MAAIDQDNKAPVLEVKNLTTRFFTSAGSVHAVDGVSFSIPPGRALGLVGESGSGKTMTALSLIDLVPPPGVRVGGSIWFGDRDLMSTPPEEIRRLRGTEIAIVLQNPLTSLNPVQRIGEQITEVAEVHRDLSDGELRDLAVQMLELVHIPDPSLRVRSYPHELSGGMRQRVAIATAVSCEPALLIADEPTTALDVTLQLQVIRVLQELRASSSMALLLITHDLGLAAELCDEIAVMYAGQIVEKAPLEQIFNNPLHPYTQGLIRSLPGQGRPRERLGTIPGQPPDLTEPPPGCRFADRCALANEHCWGARPALVQIEPGREVRCFLHAPAVEEPLEVSA